jgi:hypothetical protein
MKTYWGSRGLAPPFLISTLGGGEWSVSHPVCYIVGDKQTVPIGYEAGWVPEQV